MLTDKAFKCSVLALLWLVVLTISASSVTVIGGAFMVFVYSTIGIYYSFKEQKEEKV